MTSDLDSTAALRELEAAAATQQAQLIGLAAIIERLPGVKMVDRALVDAAIEDHCHHLGREVRDKACSFANGILQAARDTADEPGSFGSQEAHMRGYQRGA